MLLGSALCILCKDVWGTDPAKKPEEKGQKIDPDAHRLFPVAMYLTPKLSNQMLCSWQYYILTYISTSTSVLLRVHYQYRSIIVLSSAVSLLVKLDILQLCLLGSHWDFVQLPLWDIPGNSYKSCELTPGAAHETNVQLLHAHPGIWRIPKQGQW